MKDVTSWTDRRIHYGRDSLVKALAGAVHHRDRRDAIRQVYTLTELRQYEREMRLAGLIGPAYVLKMIIEEAEE